MDKILIISDNKDSDTLSLSLNKLGICASFSEKKESGEILKILFEDKYPIVFLIAPKCDEDYIDLAILLREKTEANVLLSLNSADDDTILSLIKKGVFVLNYPPDAVEIKKAIYFIEAARRRFDDLKKENDGLIKKVEDMKIIDRAKCCLIHYLRIPEATAHRHIEKQAMDMRCSKRKVAEEILKKYES